MPLQLVADPSAVPWAAWAPLEGQDQAPACSRAPSTVSSMWMVTVLCCSVGQVLAWFC